MRRNGVLTSLRFWNEWAALETWIMNIFNNF